MTGREFQRRASAVLGGHGWQVRFARAIGANSSTLRRWVSSDEVPGHAAALVELLEAAEGAVLLFPQRWRDAA